MPGPSAQLAKVRERHALQLRLVDGLTYQEIADTLLPCPAHRPSGSEECSLCGRMYASRASAYKAVRRAMERDYPPLSDAVVEEYVREQAAQLRLLISRMIRDAVDEADPVDRARAANTAARLMQRKAALEGLDAARRDPSDEELDAEIRDLLEELTGPAAG